MKNLVYLISFVMLMFPTLTFSQVIASFTSSDTVVCSGERITFTNTSQNATYYTWDVDGDRISTNSTASFRTSGTNTYVVMLIASNASRTEYDTAIVTVRSIAAPNAHFNLDQNPYDGFYCLKEGISISGWSGNTHFDSIHWTFGDGATSNLRFPRHKYGKSGTYQIKVEVFNECGTDSYTADIILADDGKASPQPYLYVPTNVCPDEEFNVMVSVNGADSVRTFLGDGNSTLLTEFTYSYSQFGAKTITSIAYGKCGSDTTTAPILVGFNHSKQPDLRLSNSRLCKGEDLFVSSTITNMDSLFVDFGDGSTTVLTKEMEGYIHSYSSQGSYTLVAYRSFECGKSDTMRRNIIVESKIDPYNYNIYLPTTQYCLNEEISFSGPYMTFGSSLNVDWGDGSIENFSFEDNVSKLKHKYSSTGIKNIAVSLRNNCGGERTSSISLRIGDYAINASIFLQYPSEENQIQCTGDTIVFGLNTTGREISSAKWEFEDGSILWGRSVKKVFDKNGAHKVFCTVSSLCGNQTFVAHTVRIDNKFFLPKALFWAYPSTVCVHSEVLFDNVSMGAREKFWKFGDGNVKMQDDDVIHILHEYSSPGLYTASLVATNACGSDSMEQNVLVVDGPMVDFESDKEFTVQGDSIKFTNKTKGATEGHWQIDGELYHEGIDDIVYSTVDIGEYTVEFWAKDVFGCWQFKSMKVTFGGLGLTDFEDGGQKWTVYPNPTKGIVNIRSSIKMSTARVRVISMSGQIVIDEVIEFGAGEAKLDMSEKGIQSGLYHISIEAEGQHHYGRLIINR